MSAPTVLRPTYRYRLECWQDRAQRVLEIPLERRHFDRAIQATLFEGLRRGRFSTYQAPPEGIRIEPTFPGRHPSPLASGFTITVPTPDGGEHSLTFSSSYFHSKARRQLAALVVQNQLAGEGVLGYRLAAYLEEDQPRHPRLGGMLLEDDSPAIPIKDRSLRHLGTLVAWDSPVEEDLRVVIPHAVLEDAIGEARAFPEHEVGGFLLGHLCRDPETRELFLLATCHLPAEHTEATDTSVTFTPESWTRAREVIALRGEEEMFVGWVHSHPFRFCAECPMPARPECQSKILFFSSDDVFLMELTCPQPFMVGLQTAVEPRLEQALGHLPVRLYGWRQGEVTPRGFHVIPE